MAEERVGDAAGRLNANDDNRVGLGDALTDAGEGRFLRQLIDIANGIQLHLQRQAGAIRLRLLL